MPNRVVGFSNGVAVTDDDIERMADEAERGYDVDELLARRGGRPRLGSASAEVVPVLGEPAGRGEVFASEGQRDAPMTDSKSDRLGD